MTKRKNKPQDNTEIAQLSKNRSYKDLMHKDSLLYYPGKDEWRERLLFTMRKWTEETDHLEVQSFLFDHNIPYSTFKDWVDKFPDVKQEYDRMKLFIAVKRRELSMRNKINGNWAYRDMHRLDPEWWPQVDKYHAEMKKEEAQEPTKFVIIADRPKVVSKEEMKGITDETV